MVSCQTVQTAKYALAEVVNSVLSLNIYCLLLISGFRRAFALIPTEQTTDETQPNSLTLQWPDPRVPGFPAQHSPVGDLEHVGSLLLSQTRQPAQPPKLLAAH